MPRRARWELALYPAVGYSHGDLVTRVPSVKMGGVVLPVM
jgi:hypothetical protein